ncbi:MAG: histidine--tRNA ligase [Myxococcota bacterium]|nr:histidine--tRNA ligase [Myxococcota bacterium]
MTSYRSVKGMNDLFGEQAAGLIEVEQVARRLALAYGAQEVRTPILEHQELFVRSVGEGTDVVGKEMYAFEDRDGSHLVLRPEATAAVARMVVQHSLLRTDPKLRAFYAGPMFRRERPQKGRYRQFHQIGLECFGEPSPVADIECIALAKAILDALGLDDVVIELGNVGGPDTRPGYLAKLTEYLDARRDELPQGALDTAQRNPLRLLDSKDAKVQELLLEAPLPMDHLNDAHRAHHEAVYEGLVALGVEVRENKRMVRGLDYYRGPVFEALTEKLGAQAAVLAGGRYDGLLETVGGPDVAAVGFAGGTERLLLVAQAHGRSLGAASPDLGVVAAPGADHHTVLRWVTELRASGCCVVADLSGRSVKAQMKAINRRGCRYALVLGATELESNAASLRRMADGSTVNISLEFDTVRSAVMEVE